METARETISKITRANSMDSTVQGKELSVSVLQSLTQSDQFALTNTPPPGLFFSPGTGIRGASPQKQD